MTALLTLALGIGVNTPFSVSPKPFWCDRLLAQSSSSGGRHDRAKEPGGCGRLLRWENPRPVLRTDCRVSYSDMNVTGSDEPERVYGAAVTADFFAVLGVAPVHGREFLRGEDEPGHDQILILITDSGNAGSERTPPHWERLSTSTAKPYTMIGVMDRNAEFPCPRSVDPSGIVSERKKRIAVSIPACGRAAKGRCQLTAAQAEMTLLDVNLLRPTQTRTRSASFK